MSRLTRDVAPGLGLGPGPEFDLIRSFLETAETARPAGVRLGPGDDCAVVAGDGIALSSDMSVEGIHFRRDWLSLGEIGFRAATAALSDLAAVAARPIGGLVSLALPASDPRSSARELMAGVRRAFAQVGGVLLGGDLVASPGPLIIDVTVVGEAADPVLRRGATPGDELWVTGELGGAGAAVRSWLGGESPAADARSRFADPRARVAEARWLAERGATKAMIDLSDGLIGDAGHLATAGAVRIELRAESIPIHPAVSGITSSAEEALRVALGAGEDYELCFASPEGQVDALRADFEASFGVPLSCVGRIVEGSGVVVLDGNGDVIPVEFHAYQHFEGPS